MNPSTADPTLTYPPGAPGPGWAPTPPPWLVQTGIPAPGPEYRPRRGPRKVWIAGAIAAVVLSAAATFGLSAYAKHTVCSSLSEGATFNNTLSDNSSDEPSADDIDKMRDAADDLRSYGRLVMFDQDLRSAVNGFADDIDQLADLMGATGDDDDGEGFAQLLTLAGSVNTHVRQAQQACGLPVKGIFND
jgi:hypothetical protein